MYKTRPSNGNTIPPIAHRKPPCVLDSRVAKHGRTTENPAPPTPPGRNLRISKTNCTGRLFARIEKGRQSPVSLPKIRQGNKKNDQNEHTRRKKKRKRSTWRNRNEYKRNRPFLNRRPKIPPPHNAARIATAATKMTGGKWNIAMNISKCRRRRISRSRTPMGLRKQPQKPDSEGEIDVHDDTGEEKKQRNRTRETHTRKPMEVRMGKWI